MDHITPLFLNSGLLWRYHELDEIIAITDRGDGGPPRSKTAEESFLSSSERWSEPMENAFPPAHEFSHLCSGYMKKDIRGKVHPYEYRGSTMSEREAEAINQVVNDVFFYMVVKDRRSLNMRSKSSFANTIHNGYRNYYSEESLLRTVAWVAGGNTGQTYDQIRSGYNVVWSSTQELAQHHGIEIWNGTCVFSGNEKYTITAQPEALRERLPEGSNGVEDFYSYLPPTSEEIDALYLRTTRLYDFLVKVCEGTAPLWRESTKGYAARIFSKLPMSDVVAAIKGQESPALKPKIKEETLAPYSVPVASP